MNVPEANDLQAYLERLSHRNREVAVNFVHVELQTGLSSCRFVRHSQYMTEERRNWHLEFGRKALAHAEGAMWKLKMTHPDFDQLMAMAERLKFELSNLSES